MNKTSGETSGKKKTSIRRLKTMHPASQIDDGGELLELKHPNWKNSRALEKRG